MKNKQIVKKGIWMFFVLTALCLYFFPSTVYGITPKRFSWNGFVYEKEDAKDGHVIIVDYTKNERKVTIPSEIRGEKVEVVSSLGDSKKIKLTLPSNAASKTIRYSSSNTKIAFSPRSK